jgi:signal transduction histidine kinase
MTRGLSRYAPAPDVPAAPPPVLISGLRVGGSGRLVSALGESEMVLPDFSHNDNQLQLDFVGLSFAPGNVLRYQYKLEGADDDWSAPSEQRRVNYASLAPGRYRFLVRAANSDGSLSAVPASVTFTILRPVWQRGWFLTLAALAIGLGVYALYRYRVERLVEVERIRTRIATDLHDDIGSGLSQVSLLSEVIRRRVGHEETVAEPLSTIATLSRDLVDSMGDIVWAINPRRDRLSDLTQRMRRFASDVLSAQDIEFSFNVPDPQHNIRLGPDMRRELFLIFKESINNIVRHSGCAAVEITFLVTDGALELTLRDDGRGFDPDSASASEGNGLDNMRRRARKLGGQLLIRSSTGRGTEINLKAPLERQQWLRYLLTRRRG